MCRIIIMLSLLGCFPNNAQQKTINVDSLFAKSINDLKIIANDSISHDLKDRNQIEFMWIISLIGNKDFVNPHQTIHINKKIVSEIEQWYIANKQYITSSNIEKAYNLIHPPAPLFESHETWMEWMNKQYEGFEIETIK